jgi:hypothetical protein
MKDIRKLGGRRDVTTGLAHGGADTAAKGRCIGGTHDNETEDPQTGN